MMVPTDVPEWFTARLWGMPPMPCPLCGVSIETREAVAILDSPDDHMARLFCHGELSLGWRYACECGCVFRRECLRIEKMPGEG